MVRRERITIEISDQREEQWRLRVLLKVELKIIPAVGQLNFSNEKFGWKFHSLLSFPDKNLNQAKVFGFFSSSFIFLSSKLLIFFYCDPRH